MKEQLSKAQRQKAENQQLPKDYRKKSKPFALKIGVLKVSSVK
jgi:hypothetical protein